MVECRGKETGNAKPIQDKNVSHQRQSRRKTRVPNSRSCGRRTEYTGIYFSHDLCNNRPIKLQEQFISTLIQWQMTNSNSYIGIVETQIEHHRNTEKSRNPQITATFQSFTSDVKDLALSCQSNSDEKQCVIYPTISGPQEFEGHLLMSFKDSEAKLPGS